MHMREMSQSCFNMGRKKPIRLLFCNIFRLVFLHNFYGGRA